MLSYINYIMKDESEICYSIFCKIWIWKDEWDLLFFILWLTKCIFYWSAIFLVIYQYIVSLNSL